NINPNNIFYDSRISSLYTATASAGVAWNRLLLYVKGGWAGARVEQSSTLLQQPGNFFGPFAFADVRRNANGWTVGTGFEVAVTNSLSIGLEYNYIQLSARDVNTCETGLV